MGEKFRPNVAALVIDKKGNLLVCERVSPKGAWQFPQGGVDPGEIRDSAIMREVEEEIGLKESSYSIGRVKSGYRYRFPEFSNRPKQKLGFVGQEQTYFELILDQVKPKIEVEQKDQEFRDYRWIKPKEFDLKWLPKFKREVYKQVLSDFFEVNLKD